MSGKQMMRRSSANPWKWTGLVVLWGCMMAPAAEPKPKPVEFNRDIRPIFSDNCFACHGPDKNKRKANLRLDLEEGLFGPKDSDGGEIAILMPGKPDESELFRRITATDEKVRMPQAKFGKRLSTR